ncbi:hypothetical protein E9232_003705 [Inquilinus ginsengisoli]|uniref:Uncharacterized protein n=1 Tax=Inquilinus ginsengisoli TaxID=363840 RepID=A0ABU1JT56_9PROT|nr:hypothetical protein [Inquilinus ginsengisoli]
MPLPRSWLSGLKALRSLVYRLLKVRAERF